MFRRTIGARLTVTATLLVGLLALHTRIEMLLASPNQQVARRYSPIDSDEARGLALQAWGRKEFPSLPIGIPSEWTFNDLKFDAKGFRVDRSDHVVLAGAAPAANHLVQTRPVSGGCFVPTGLLFASTDLFMRQPGAQAPTTLRAGGYILWVGRDGVLLTGMRNERAVVVFDAPINLDPCDSDVQQRFEVAFVVSPEEVLMQLAGRTITLK